MSLSLLSRRAKISVYPSISTSFRKIFISMAASNDESNKENVADGEVEQIVTMEKVIAADNKGIDYDKLISELLPVSFCYFRFRRAYAISALSERKKNQIFLVMGQISL